MLDLPQVTDKLYFPDHIIKQHLLTVNYLVCNFNVKFFSDALFVRLLHPYCILCKYISLVRVICENYRLRGETNFSSR